MSGGRASKRKGSDGEREIARILGGKRVPLSGAAKASGEEYAGDIIAPRLGRGEVKRRRDGFRQLYGWLADNNFLAIRADRREWLVVLRVDDLLKILEGGNADDR